MASFVGTPTQGAVSPAVAVWTINTPAGSAGQTQLLAVSYKPKGSTAGSLAGWQTIRNYPHTTSPAALVLYQRKLTSSVSAGTANLAFGAAAEGGYICQTVDGDYASSPAPVEQDGTSSVTLPSFTAADADTAVLEIWASGEWPRVFPTTSGVSVTHQVTISGPGLTIGRRVVPAGAVVGTTFVPDDPSPGGIDTAYSGTEDWGPTIGSVVMFRTANTGGGTTGSDVTGQSGGTFTTGTSQAVTVPAGVSGDSQYIAVNFAPTIGFTNPSGWTVVSASDADEYQGKLVVFERVLTGAQAAQSVSVTFAGNVSGAIAAINVRGRRHDVQRNAGSQGVFSREWAAPSVASNAANSVAINFVASANFFRSVTPASDVTELIDLAATPSLAIGKKLVGSGTATMGNWIPADAFTVGGDGGDAYRSISIAVTPSAVAPPSGTLSATVAGAMVWIPTPGLPVASEITATTTKMSWSDLTSDETAFRYMYRKEGEAWPANSTALPANVTSILLTGLSSGQDYRFIVLAQRGSDFSAWSAEAFWRTTSVFTGINLVASAQQVDGSVVVTATVQPVEAGATVTWAVTDGIILNRSTVTNSSGQATLTFTRLTAGVVTITATAGGITRSLLVNYSPVTESLILTISPAQIERGYVALARVTGSFGGAYWRNKAVSLVSSNTNIIASPLPAVMQPTTGSGSEWTFTLPGIANGTTTLTAYIDGTASNSVAVVVADPAGPSVYTAGVATHCSITIEAPLAAAVRPMLRRMTDADQRFHYPGDEGYKFMAIVRTREAVFFTRSRQMQKSRK